MVVKSARPNTVTHHLDAGTGHKIQVFLKDPRNGANNAGILDVTRRRPWWLRCDVYFGIFSNPTMAHAVSCCASWQSGGRENSRRFWLGLHARRCAGQHGAAVHRLLFVLISQYNNHAMAMVTALTDAPLDPNATQTDPPIGQRSVEMREV